ncbi:RNA 2',3'-cyclic phosphodiesterase [Slackia equolifaciens]|uniref:RNA 2',3'-cyclic phosphodiesterase n=1 Tax=Slackia equolifaciens TaxID=498718 RepID=A0A3N0B477_9ACTN|nr:RNA 2',3'-cyclic phosphodiesterase [Slackia equolifaciens]RNL41921.1 RNA 2',3'-cyclic phosphodiesterase [Slackia equolifaciens]
MRTFIALELPDNFAAETAALARALHDHVDGRFMKPETYHLTLAFLGDIDERELGLAIEATDAACEGGWPIELSCTGLGTFGRKNDATLWLGIQINDPLAQLVFDLQGQLEARDVSYDAKMFKPHITLARRARIPRVALPDLPFPRAEYATRVTVFKSELSPEGAVYKPLHTVELG